MKTKEDLQREKAKKASDKLLKDRFEAEWNTVIKDCNLSQNTLLDKDQMKKVFLAFKLLTEIKLKKMATSTTNAKSNAT